MADDYDFQINSLKFRSAASDRFPYERGTAPFRKDQFDSSPTVGDQSLAGWWTRGQLSFHKGAGIKYLDLQQGDTLNTFWYGRDIQVMRPGEVRPIYVTPSANKRTSFFSSTIQQLPTYDGFGIGVYATGGEVHRLSGFGDVADMTDTAIPPAFSNDPAGITVGPNDAWAGMSNGSVEYINLSTDTANLLWDHSGSVNLWIQYDEARSRIWVINHKSVNDAYVYMLDTVGGTFTVADAVATVPQHQTFGLEAVLCPSGLVTAAGTRLFLVSVDEDGTVTPPVQIAETASPISALAYHSGQFILGCRDGLRIGELSGTELIYGPAFGPTWADANDYAQLLIVDSMVALAGKAYAGCRWYIEQTPGVGTEFSGVIQINLDDQTDLVPSWSEFVVNGTGASAFDDPTYVNVFRNGIATVHNQVLSLHPVDTGSSTNAYLVTGYHRLGTLELKRFYTLTVKAQGTRGSIAVAAIDATGVETSLGTLTITYDGSVQVVSQDFSMPTTLTERYALKFSWTASTDAAPTLTGYQLRALPAPERQRILRWPLLVQDHVKLRRGVTVGKKGRAYSDVTALEALESSSAVVTFTDHRTGETGTAYVDSVEFQADTPSSDNTSGFGGVAYVTLRVLA